MYCSYFFEFLFIIMSIHFITFKTIFPPFFKPHKNGAFYYFFNYCRFHSYKISFQLICLALLLMLLQIFENALFLFALNNEVALLLQDYLYTSQLIFHKLLLLFVLIKVIKCNLLSFKNLGVCSTPLRKYQFYYFY